MVDLYDFPIAVTCIGFMNLAVALLFFFYQSCLWLQDRTQTEQTHSPLYLKADQEPSTTVDDTARVATHSSESPTRKVDPELTPLLSDGDDDSIYGTKA